MIFEIPITVIDHESGLKREVTAIVNTITRETNHVARTISSDAILWEEEPDG